jgi:hypothetical protein
MLKRLGFWLPLSFAAAFTLGFASCDKAENALDCASICDRYKDCWNKDFDSGKCRTDCRTKANNDTGFEAKVDMCAACIEDKSCSGSFACVADCTPVIAN